MQLSVFGVRETTPVEVMYLKATHNCTAIYQWIISSHHTKVKRTEK